MKKAYCLYRVSTKKQVDKAKDDIPMQKIACTEFAEQNGWVIAKEFYEKGVSGFKVSANDRDAIQDLKEAALNHEFDVLLVYMFDRLGRRDDNMWQSMRLLTAGSSVRAGLEEPNTAVFVYSDTVFCCLLMSYTDQNSTDIEGGSSLMNEFELFKYIVYVVFIL